MMDCIKAIVAIVLWLPVSAIKIVLIVLGFFIVVPIGLATGKMPRLYETTRGIHTFWEMAIRNPVDGMKYLIQHPDTYSTWGTEHVEPTQTSKRLVWRLRRSGLLAGFRLVWRYNAKRYGEMYIGWKIGSEPPHLDFALSLRPYATIGR